MKIIFPFLFIFVVGCASVPKTEYEEQTEKILKSDILNDNHSITILEKKEIKQTLLNNNVAMIQDQKKIQNLIKETQSEKKWATIGEYGFFLSGIIFLLLIFKIGFAIFKLFTKL
jgi:hypothetical protein